MTTIAEDAAKLSELDADVARAWRAYRASTVELDADAYASREPEIWQHLQDELARIESLRAGCLLVRLGAGGHGSPS